tara:strand:+ start:542 stop:1981 length:1440 start_codon:yes stop_codon:yes gene_type:complete
MPKKEIEYHHCELCDYKNEDEDYLIYVDDYKVCQDCYDEHYFTCYNCDESTHDDNHHTVDNEDWCQDCYEENSFYCESCSENYSYDNVGMDDDGTCMHCSENNDGMIHDYSYKPTPIIKLLQFNKNQNIITKKLVNVGYNSYNRMLDKNLKKDDFQGQIFKSNFGHYENTGEVIGFELEVENKKQDENNGQIAEHLYKAMDDVNEDFIYIKRDGSLDYGFEIVTHPQSYMAWMNSLERYQPIFDLSSKGIRSHDTRTCGLHFSLNRKAFTPMHLLKFSIFIYHNPLFIKDVSRRKMRNLVTWANVFSKSIYKSEKYEVELMIKGKKRDFNQQGTFYNKIGKYYSPIYTTEYLAKNMRNCRNTAVNITGDRVECRFFRGTLKKDTLVMNLQFVHSLFEFTKQAKMENLEIFSFTRFCEKNNYNLVNEYLQSIDSEKTLLFCDYFHDTKKAEKDFRNNKLPIEYFSYRDDNKFKIGGELCV